MADIKIIKNWNAARRIIDNMNDIFKNNTVFEGNNTVIKDKDRIFVLFKNNNDIIKNKLANTNDLIKSLSFYFLISNSEDYIRFLLNFSFGVCEYNATQKQMSSYNSRIIGYEGIINYYDIILDPVNNELLPDLIMKFALSHNKYINSTDFDNKYIKTISNIINLDPNEEATVNIYSIEKNIKNFLSQNKNKEEEIDIVKKKIIFNGYDDIFLSKLNVKI